jgi:hypothetical protein
MKHLPFISLIILLILIGCKPCKEVTKTVIERDTIRESHIKIEYRDTIAYKEIKGKTVYIEKPVYIEKGIVNSQPIIQETELCKSTAQVINSQLINELMQKDTTLRIKLNNALKTITELKTELIKEKTENTKTITIREDTRFGKFAKKTVVILFVFIVLLIVAMIYKNKLLSLYRLISSKMK